MQYQLQHRHRSSWDRHRHRLQYPYREIGRGAESLWVHTDPRISDRLDLKIDTGASVEPEEEKRTTRVDIPGYTVMTRSMSAAVPISSVMAVDGVSGDMATPARIPRR